MSAQSFGPVNREFSPERMFSSAKRGRSSPGRLTSLFGGFAAFLTLHDRIDAVCRLCTAGKVPLSANSPCEAHRYIEPLATRPALLLHLADLSTCARLAAACRSGLPLVVRAARRDFARPLTHTVQGTSP
jgi:hypothetical protein